MNTISDRKSFILRLIAVPAALIGIKLFPVPQQGCLFNRKGSAARPIYDPYLPNINQKILRMYPRLPHECYKPIGAYFIWDLFEANAKPNKLLL